jgi:peptidoglycan/xylan/chitin deacetylase (PgdA/CDA1 family)
VNEQSSLPPVVLAYHALGSPGPDAFSRGCVAPPALLEAHSTLLAGLGYRFVSAGELVEARVDGSPPRGLAALTFDDGWQSDLAVTAPLLEALGLPATFFLCPGLFGNRDERLGAAGQVLTEVEARELAARPFELGAHTMTHPDVRSLEPNALRRELADAKGAVEDLAERPCTLLAWPFGLSSPSAERACREAGYRAAFSYSSGPWRRFAAPRLPAGNLSVEALSALLAQYAE